MCANTPEEVCPECDTQPVAKPRSGKRVRVAFHASRVVQVHLKARTRVTGDPVQSSGKARRAPGARVVLTKRAHRHLRRSSHREGKIPSTGEWEVVKS